MRLAFLGAGKMGTAIAKGIVDAGILPTGHIRGCDISVEAREAFTQATGGSCCVSSAGDVLDACDVLVVAVKPQSLEKMAAELPSLPDSVLVISIAAGIPLTRLTQWFGTGRIIRAMPNTPLTVARGATVFSRGPAAGDPDAATARRLFGALGFVEEVPEELIDAVTATSGSGPAYVFEFIQALADAGVGVGLSPDLALALTVQTVAGAAEMLCRGLGEPEELRRAVTSPGGTTAAGLAVLEEAGFRDLLARVVRAARDRSVELGRQS